MKEKRTVQTPDRTGPVSKKAHSPCRIAAAGEGRGGEGKSCIAHRFSPPEAPFFLAYLVLSAVRREVPQRRQDDLERRLLLARARARGRLLLRLAVLVRVLHDRMN